MQSSESHTQRNARALLSEAQEDCGHINTSV